jgi:hypothetical protein
MNFQKIVLTIAIIVLIVVLILIGLSLSKVAYEENWPPIVGACPDYWVDLSGNGEQCFNSHNLGRCNIPTKDNENTMNFNQSPFNSIDGTCAKYKWAKTCNVSWDGITLGIQNPCDKSTEISS